MASQKNIDKAIEELQCAEINCDNVKKLGAFFVDAVKMQIQEALKLLEDEAALPDSETEKERGNDYECRFGTESSGS